MSGNLPKMEQAVTLQGSDYKTYCLSLALCYRSVSQEERPGSSFGWGIRIWEKGWFWNEGRKVNQETQCAATTWISNSQPPLSGHCAVYVLTCVRVDRVICVCVSKWDGLLSHRTQNSSRPCTCCSPIQGWNLFLLWVNRVICFDQRNVVKVTVWAL